MPFTGPDDGCHPDEGVILKLYENASLSAEAQSTNQSASCNFRSSLIGWLDNKVDNGVQFA